MLASIHTVLSRIRSALRPTASDSDFDDELATHLEMAERDKVRAGMDPDEARRTARLELGGLAQLRESGRAARGLPWAGSFALDFKLGLRMLRKTWGVTLVGGAAMTVTIGIGATVFAVLDTVEGGRLPFDGGDRIVAIQTYDPVGRTDYDTSLADFELWREELDSVGDVGAYITVEQDLAATNGPAGPVAVARMTASAFGIAGVDPVLGRPITPEDESPDAPQVALISHDVWESQFASEPGIIGDGLDLDGTFHTIIGVMPEGYRFPVNHDLWTPLRLADAPRDVPALFVMGRLAPGVTVDSAAAEVSTVGLLPSDSVGAGGEPLRTRVVPYASTFNDDFRDEPWIVRIILALASLLLVPPAANIAILMYARNVTRREEFATRYVLGAGRTRMVSQLFIEALILALGAGILALLLAGEALTWVRALVDQELGPGFPYWVDFGITVETVLFVALLALFTATIAGVIPALWATGGMQQSGLHALGGQPRMRLGKTWTGLVAVQVALSMAVLPAVGEILWETFKSTLIGPGFESGEFLTARVAMEGESSGTEQADTGRFGNLQGELVRELEENGGRTRGALSQFQPGFGAQRNMESDTSAEARRALIRTAFDRVDEGYFEVFGQSLLAGRGFEAGDFQTGRTSVIVNRTFVDRSRNALGRRFRTPATAEGGAPGPWYEIVGVVEDLAPNETQATMYHPMVPGQVHPVNLTLHVGDPMPDEIGGRIREVTIALDPSLRVGAFRPLDEVFGELYFVRNMIASSILAGLAIVLLFTLAGVNTLMAFTVAQSRREIGIRSALGAERWRLLTDIFRKGLIPVVAGAAIGWLIAFGIDIYLSGDGGSVYALSGAAAFMLVLGVLSLAGPARKITKVEPTAVLKDS